MAEVIDRWLQSGQFAVIESRCLAPLRSPHVSGTATCMRRRQAEAFIVQDPLGHRFVLKKFVGNQAPRIEHLRGVAAVLPAHEGFRAGRERRMLDHNALRYEPPPYYFCPELARWLENTVLMPQILGSEWNVVADERREACVMLSPDSRFPLALGLSRLVELLERAGVSHRDLSGANVLVDSTNNSVSLIDFDGLFHRRLPLPGATVCGTEGYMAPYVWNGGNADPKTTWCPNADRFALAVLIAEIFSIAPAAPTQGDGGLFTQDELAARRGPGIDWARQKLRSDSDAVSDLFDAALRSRSFSQCPSPSAWVDALETAYADDGHTQFEDAQDEVLSPLYVRNLITLPPYAYYAPGTPIELPPPVRIQLPPPLKRRAEPAAAPPPPIRVTLPARAW